MALDRLRLSCEPVDGSAKELVGLFREEFLGDGKLEGGKKTKLFQGIITIIDNMRNGNINKGVALELAYNISTPRYFDCDSLVRVEDKTFVSAYENEYAYVGIGFMADEFEYDGNRVVHRTLDEAERFKTSFDLVKLRNDLADFVGIPKCDEGTRRLVVVFNDRNDLVQICG